MGKQLIQQMLPAIGKLDWPEELEATELGRIAYMDCVEKAEAFRGSPKTLAAALRVVQTGQSRPYASAGIAYCLLVAAKESDGSYDQEGLDAAMGWLEEAQSLEPDLLEVNTIEALIYIHGQRMEDARLILDYLAPDSGNDYLFATAEAAYWSGIGNVGMAVQWFETAADRAATVPQRLRAQRRLADAYHRFGILEEALKAYREAYHFDQSNPDVPHNMSIVCYKLENIDEAIRYNELALKLEPDFVGANKMAEVLKRKKRETGALGRLFRRE
jgi:tetratricopeptide (TPR) repeat protein